MIKPKDHRRFWKKVVELPNGCWQWTAAKHDAGYGRFRFAGKMVYAHRWAYETLVGPIPEGLQIDHLCRNPPCVNPSHLEPVTNRENTMRGLTPKTHCPQGHPYSGDNLGITKDKYAYQGKRRFCRQCSREADKRYHDKRREFGQAFFEPTDN